MNWNKSPKTRAHVFTALKTPPFRRYWMGSLASVLGFQIMLIAQGWLVYDLSGEEIYLGYAGLAAGIPAILLNAFGGVVADKVDPRRLLMITQTACCVLMIILGIITSLGIVEIWHVLLFAFLIGCVNAFDMPTRQALFPHLIKREDMMNAVALNSMVWQGTRVVGPAIGGVIIGTRFGEGPGFFAASVGFVAMAFVAYSLVVPEIKRASGNSMAHELIQGVRYVWTHPIFLFLIGMTFFNSIFGMSYNILLPVFARDIFDVGSSGLGLLGSAAGCGAIIGTIFTASLGNFKHKGRLVFGGAISFGLLLILFAVTSSAFAFFPLALVLVFFAGLSTSVYMVTVMTTLQMLVPDELRGRVMGLYYMTFSLMPIGALQSGVIAQYTSAPFAVAVGGAAVVLFAVVMGVFNRQVRNLGSVA